MIPEIKQRATHRSKIIEGQFKALIKAIDDENYCIDILVQSLAIQKSLGSLNKLILENHLQTHIKDGMSNGSEKEKNILTQELLQLYEINNLRSK